MGMFKSKEEREVSRQERSEQQAERERKLLEKLERKAREKAAKRGLVTDGALFVADGLTERAAHFTFLVWPDRVEIHNYGQVGSLFRTGKGVESMPIVNVASVQSRAESLFGIIEVHGSGNSIEARLSQPEASRAREVIAELVQADKSAPAASSHAPTVVNQMKQLAELRDAGVITQEEFEGKKAELLSRM